MSVRVNPEFRPAQALALLAATTHPAEHQSLHTLQVLHQPRPIVIDPVVLIVPLKFRVEDRLDFRYRSRQLTSQPVLHCR